MSVQPSTAPSQVQRFWDKYLKYLHQEGIKHPFDQWYVKRAEAFLRSSPRRLSERSAGDVEAFFRSFGRNPGLKAWQFRQIVDPTRMLLEVARVARRRRLELLARFRTHLGERPPHRRTFHGPVASDESRDGG